MPSYLKGLPKDNTCRDPEHNPPTHIMIPSGKKLIHECPRCKQIKEVFSQVVTFNL